MGIGRLSCVLSASFQRETKRGKYNFLLFLMRYFQLDTGNKTIKNFGDNSTTYKNNSIDF